jgi:hypothetical protein
LVASFFYCIFVAEKINIKSIKKWKKKNTFLNQLLLVYLITRQKQLVQQMDLKNITINVVTTHRLKVCGLEKAQVD